jgi:hypothetical protein
MMFAILEAGAIMLALLLAVEARRQGIAWRPTLIRSLIVLGASTAVIALWRGR